MWNWSVQCVAQLDTWKNAAWRQSFIRVRVLHWPPLQFLVSYCWSTLLCQLQLEFALCSLTQQSPAGRYQVCSLSVNWIGSPQLSYGQYDPRTCTDESSCCTMWSLKCTHNRHVAQLVHRLHFDHICHQNWLFGYVLFLLCRSYQHYFVQIRFLYVT